MKLFLILLCSFVAFADPIDQFYKDKWPLSHSSKKKMLEGEIVADADVNSANGQQEFKLEASAYHSRKCKRVLKKLSRFEEYADWIGFIKKSSYSEKNELITIFAEHMLLPFPMIVRVKIKRPTSPGVYPFVFPIGIFQGLSGTLHVGEVNKRCIFAVQSYWKGKKTKIPNFVVEVFSETLSIMAGKVLFRKTNFTK